MPRRRILEDQAERCRNSDNASEKSEIDEDDSDDNNEDYKGLSDEFDEDFFTYINTQILCHYISGSTAVTPQVERKVNTAVPSFTGTFSLHFQAPIREPLDKTRTQKFSSSSMSALIRQDVLSEQEFLKAPPSLPCYTPRTQTIYRERCRLAFNSRYSRTIPLSFMEVGIGAPDSPSSPSRRAIDELGQWFRSGG
ncbi:hypothetical protein EVAR_73080_1 [Eumeta japonica]|uniref:Uncharacterized protein n=1 Tax=Eumeta variegata TaxID=151549 RepID=A0A4C1SP10_EUMVA|nr:hypothetical protein EVAR_73080_1 [Eumeta japonica]